MRNLSPKTGQIQSPARNMKHPRKDDLLVETLVQLPNIVVTVHRMYPKLAEYSQLVVTGEARKVEVDVVNRLILLNLCRVVRIDRDVLFHEADVVETKCHQTIVTMTVQTMIVVTEIAVDVVIINVTDQDEDEILRPTTTIRTTVMVVTGQVMIVHQKIMK